ncbi:MAG: hypothetical protein ACREQ9_07700, partial [Candidatus Binatia bacterium]
MTRKADRSFESLLERGLRAAASPGGECAEPEILAAYLERSLSAAERMSCEEHFAACLRCQEELAAIVRMEPPPARAFGWLRLPSLRWMAPLAAGATGVIALTLAIRLAPQGEA